MGMYNEVWAPCPVCKVGCYTQIPQVVLGFGDFHLNDPESFINDFTDDELAAFKTLVEDELFHCEEHGPFRIRMVIQEVEEPANTITVKRNK